MGWGCLWILLYRKKCGYQKIYRLLRDGGPWFIITVKGQAQKVNSKAIKIYKLWVV